MKKIFAGLLMLCILAVASYVYPADQDKPCVCNKTGPAMKQPVMQGYYWQTPECQKFYDETVNLRRQLHDKEFELFEASRNPKTLGGTIEKMDNELQELNKQINAQAPIGCWW